MNYGTLIREKREASGMSLEDMAVALDMTLSVYGKVEQGTKPLTIRTLEKIAQVLEVNVQELVPSLAGKYSGDRYNYDRLSNSVVNHYSFESKRDTLQELIKVKEETIAAQNTTIEALKMALAITREKLLEAIRDEKFQVD